MNFPLSNVTWRPSYRVIPSRFPPIDLFEGVNSHTDDWDLLNELEGETSASSLSDLRLMDELRRGFFTPPCVGVGAVVWLLTCPSASARRF